MNTSFDTAVENTEKRLKAMVESRLLKIAEGSAKHYNLNIKPTDDINWPKLIKEAEKNLEIFEIIKQKCSRVLRTGNHLEPILTQWLCDYLDGVIKRPTGRKGAPKKSGGRDFFIWNEIEFVHHKYGIPYSRNDASIPQSACDVVSKAIKNVNRNLEPGEFIKPSSYNSLRKLIIIFKKSSSFP